VPSKGAKGSELKGDGTELGAVLLHQQNVEAFKGDDSSRSSAAKDESLVTLAVTNFNCGGPLPLGALARVA
jgi:hypothetical protein